jgi:phosphate:Na+ symporter
MEIVTTIGKILTLIGSLGLFLYGMKIMSEALQKVAGGKMRQILAVMTNNRFKGALTGFLVTTTIQSSSATTVMIVSFVNAGLLSLIAAVGVIMGANIGTTVTAWIISLLGFKISLSFLSLPLIGISFPFFFSKNSLKKSWGELIIGFAILFIGLQFLKESVPDINNNPGILNFLSSFTDLGYISILIFVIIGTILTVIIQSSSATMALTLVMTYNGLIPFELAAAMILGENIGTTITANIAAFVANISAKRAARAHFIFNTFGVIWMLIVFHPFLRVIDHFMQHYHSISILSTDLSKVDYETIKQEYPIALSIFHTSFNILNTLMLIGFASLIAKIATKMVPGDDEDDEEFRLQYIDSGLFSTSELSIMQAKNEISNFGSRIEKMFLFIPSLLHEKRLKKYDKFLAKIEKYEQITDNIEIEIATYLTRISEDELTYDSSKKIRAMLKIIDDMESVGDVVYQLSIIIDNGNQRKLIFTDEQNNSLNELFEMIREAFVEMNKNLVSSYQEVNPATAFLFEKKINKKRNMMRHQHVDDLKEKKYKHKIGTYYSDVFSLTEKVGDYIINVTEAIVEYQDIK